MKAVESIIGGYLILVLLVAVATGFYAWIAGSSENINQQINDKVDLMHYINYLPVLSLEYVKDIYFKLRIHPLIPIHVKEVIVKSTKGDLLYSVNIDQLVAVEHEVEVSISHTPAILMVLTNRGIPYYYSPRADPLLANAPDYIRNKVYVDNELIEYLRSRAESPVEKNVYLMNTIGYKVLMGIVKTSPDAVVSHGPIQCPSNTGGGESSIVDIYGCNLNAMINGSYASFVTYDYNRSLWYYTSDGYLVLTSNLLRSISSTSSQYFLQVMRLVRIVDKKSNLTLNYTLRLGEGSIKLARVVSVYYVLSQMNRLDAPILLSSQIDGSVQWIHRRLVAMHYLETRENTLSNSMVLSIDPVEFGYKEMIIAVGLELVYSGDGVIYLKIDVS